MPAAKPLILFDIDKTLFNTPQFIENHLKSLAEFLNTSPQQMRETLENYRSSIGGETDFVPQEYFDHVARFFKAKSSELAELFFSPDNFHSALYPEVKKVLTQLKKDRYPLGIYSEGFEIFQKDKLKKNGIWEFFEPKHLHIMRRKMDKDLLASLPKGTIIIDDKPSIIEFLEMFPQLVPLHIVRDDQTPYGEYTLSTLYDLLPILDSLSDTRSSEE